MALDDYFSGTGGSDFSTGDFELAGDYSGWNLYPGDDSLSEMPVDFGALSQVAQAQDPMSTWVSDSQDASQAQDFQPAAAPERQNRLLKAMGAAPTKDGTATDWGDPKTITALLKALGVGGNFLSGLLSKGKQANQMSPQQLLAMQRPNPYNNWSPSQQMVADRFFNSQYAPQRSTVQASQLPSTIVPSRGYAEGGGVMGYDEGGALGQVFSGYVDSSEPGQADNIQINVSGGEYVLTPDVVSSLGDGNNAAGAKVLDEWVQSIRERSRSPEPDEIQPSMQGEQMPEGAM